MLLPDYLYDKLVVAFDRVLPRMQYNATYSITERNSSIYKIRAYTMRAWREEARAKSRNLKWDDIMHILNVLNKELPQ